MGTITRSLSNNITTGGVILPAGITNSSVSAVTSFANASAGTLTLLSTQTASASATISFTTGLDSTYDEYQFKFINCRPSSDSNTFQFQGSTNGGSTYATTITSTFFKALANEANTSAALEYVANSDLAQGTGFQCINELNDLGFDADQSISGTLTLFNPSSTTYVKHFISTTNYCHQGDYTVNGFMAGYFNTTSAINAIQFKMASNNIADGIIKLYGVKKS
jgi:hypothetical protein